MGSTCNVMQAQWVVFGHAGRDDVHEPQADRRGFDPEEPDQKAAKNGALLLPEPLTMTITQMRKVKRKR